MLAYYVHDLNPVIFDAGFFKPRWYGMAYLLGFIAAYFLIKRLARQGMLRMPESRVPDLVLNACIFGILLGGRLGYCLFYDLPEKLKAGFTPLLWDFNSDFPFWGVLRVTQGGMAAHGGVLFTILTLLVFARRNKYSTINLGDAACMVTPIGLFFGRVANFINGELYGHPSGVAWAVKFPTEIVNPTDNPFDTRPNPEEVRNVINDVNAMFPNLNITQPTELIAQLQHGAANVSEAIRSKLAAMPSLQPRHPSQLYEALLEGALLFLIVWIIGKRWRKDGMASGAFLTLYPIMRIIGEQFRVGDAPETIAGITLAKGVWYSLPMLVAGLVYWIYFIRNSKPNEWKPVEEPAPDAKSKA